MKKKQKRRAREFYVVTNEYGSTTYVSPLDWAGKIIADGRAMEANRIHSSLGKWEVIKVREVRGK